MITCLGMRSSFGLLCVFIVNIYPVVRALHSLFVLMVECGLAETSKYHPGFSF